MNAAAFISVIFLVVGLDVANEFAVIAGGCFDPSVERKAGVASSCRESLLGDWLTMLRVKALMEGASEAAHCW